MNKLIILQESTIKKWWNPGKKSLEKMYIQWVISSDKIEVVLLLFIPFNKKKENLELGNLNIAQGEEHDTISLNVFNVSK